jgi:hypothetical protein
MEYRGIFFGDATPTTEFNPERLSPMIPPGRYK